MRQTIVAFSTSTLTLSLFEAPRRKLFLLDVRPLLTSVRFEYVLNTALKIAAVR